MSIGRVIIKNTIYGPQKLKRRTITRSSNSTSGHIFEEAKVNSLKKHLWAYVHQSMVHNNHDTEFALVSIGR